MKLVIELDKETYKKVMALKYGTRLENAIKKGVLIQKGQWIDGICSKCGYIGDEDVYAGIFKYCPVCGAENGTEIVEGE